ncbi:MAG: hypothetical protein KIS66_00090 [Fimbriimonadaceae bacterium]|nr:hypothetical protein [Fimbriimonadaceae bacterium]
MKPTRRPRVAVWKFASCDGCQLTVLDCEDELLALAEAIEIAYFPEATRASSPGPYDVSLVEGSITTRNDAKRILKVRKQSRIVVAIGACATAGGIQALRNHADVADYTRAVYAHPEWIETLDKSTPIRNHVYVDYELRGCPIAKGQLLELVTALLAGRRPNLPVYSVCEECKRKGNPCVMVARGVPCMGPVTQAGCGALCPSFARGCYACFGPCEGANVHALDAALAKLGVGEEDRLRAFRGFNGYAEPFREAAEALNR